MFAPVSALALALQHERSGSDTIDMSARTIFYDPASERLIFTDHAPNSRYWDDRWRSSLEKAARQPIPPGGSFITNTTARYLPKGSKVLEGGCGNGMHSRHLHEAGFDVTSVDWAPTTIEWLKANVPQINPVEADLRDLPFPDATFDGYWSLGVIEHFYDGYEPLADEMRRVIRPGGMLFLTFPYMSPLRSLAGKLGYFPRWSEDKGLGEFHQFALRYDRVMENLSNDFELLHKEPRLALTGLEGIADGLVNQLDRVAKRSAAGKKLRSALERMATPYSGHIVLLCLKRREN